MVVNHTKISQKILLRSYFFAKLSIVDVWQCSEYDTGFEYAMVLNMPFSKYKIHFLIIRGTFWRK